MVKTDLQEVEQEHAQFLSGFGQELVTTSGENCNKHSGSIKCGEFLDQLKTVWLLRQGAIPWTWFVSYKLIFCEIWVFQGVDVEDLVRLGYHALYRVI